MNDMSNDIDHILNHISLKKSRRRWRWIAIAAIVALVIGFVAVGSYETPRGDHVARLEVNGLITGDERQLKLIRDMREDAEVKALIVRIDSPGGTTVGSEALYEELKAFGAKKPIVAVMDSVAASGGYITALATDRIYARGNTITGSIGVIFTYPDVSQLLNTVGVKMEEVKSGELKAEPSGYKPTPEKARIVMQEMVSDGFSWFKGLVGERRKLDVATVDRLSDGRVYSGRQALKEKLIDELGTEVEARAWLAKEKSIDEKLETVKREPPKEQGDLGLPFPLGHAAMESVGDLLGLKGLQQKVDAAKLDGLLVLWQPGL
jgi:protease IV